MSQATEESAPEATGKSPLKPLLWMALLLAGLIAFGAYFN